MRKFKRNTVIVVWVYVIMIATGCFLFFYVREAFSRKDYEDALFSTIYISSSVGVISSVIHTIIGNYIAKERKNWDDVINELSLEFIESQELIFLMSYIIVMVSLAIFVPAYLIAMWSPQLGF
jgi:hypothetical protein